MEIIINSETENARILNDLFKFVLKNYEQTKDNEREKINEYFKSKILGLLNKDEPCEIIIRNKAKAKNIKDAKENIERLQGRVLLEQNIAEASNNQRYLQFTDTIYNELEETLTKI